MIYFDNAATTPLSPTIIDQIKNVNEQFFANNSSMHCAGKKSAEALKDARDKVADVFGFNSNNLYFTSGATESINIVIKGFANQMQMTKDGRNQIIISSVEHPAVYNAAYSLQRSGFEIIEIEPGKDGIINKLELTDLINSKTCMVCLMHVNNETGAINDVNKLAEIVKCKNNNILFLSDSVQSIGKIPYRFNFDLIDSIIMSGHKFYAPKGIGALYLNPKFRIQPIVHGGGQEFTFRSGTVNVPGAILLSKALVECYNNINSNYRKTLELKEFVLSELSKLGVDYIETISRENTSPYILSLALCGFRSDLIINKLSEKGICVSSKSACSSLTHTKSRILESMNVPLDIIDNVLRISFSPYNNKEEAKELCYQINTIIQ